MYQHHSVFVCVRKWERESERERENICVRERDREREREIYIKRERERERERMERGWGPRISAELQSSPAIVMQLEIQIYRYTDIQIYR